MFTPSKCSGVRVKVLTHEGCGSHGLSTRKVWEVKTGLQLEVGAWRCCGGILVKLVICVSSGQLKIKIANLMQYATLAYFLPFSNTLSLENMIGNLIAPLTKLLYHIIGNSMSRGDIQNIMQWVWQDKSIYLTQMNCQRLHIDGKKYSRNQSCYFFQNLWHVFFVHSDTIAAFISSGQCSEIPFFISNDDVNWN